MLGVVVLGCKPDTTTPDVELARLTAELRALHREAVVLDDPSPLVTRLLSVAQARLGLLQQGVRDDATWVKPSLLSRAESASFPTEVTPYLERHTSESGELVALIRENERTSSHVWTLKTTPTTRLRLHFLHDVVAPAQGNPARAAVEGVVIDHHLLVTKLSMVGTAFDYERPTRRKLLVTLLKFSDTPSEPYTPAFARHSIDTNTIPRYTEMSNGLMTVEADVYGWWTMSIPRAQCDLVEIEKQFYVLAAAHGIETSGYQSFVMAFPSNSQGDCSGFSGLGSLGGFPALIYLNNNGFSSLNHELGHNLGLYHSHAYVNCEAGSYYGVTKCDTIDYGHQHDTMGTGSGHFMPFQKERIAWMGSADAPGLLNVTASGTYTIEPMAASGTGIKALKILRTAESTGTANAYYYLEYRQPINADSSQLASTDGVLINIATAGGNPYMLDMVQSTPIRQDAALVPGATYSDPVNGISITTRSATDAGATVDIILNHSMGCTRANPTLSLTARDSVVRGVSERKLYDLELTNNNSGCGPQTFDLTQTGLPHGWQLVFSPSQMLVAEGVPLKSLVGVTSAADAGLGTTSLVLTATATADVTKATSTTLSFAVTNCVRAAPSVTFDSSSRNGVAGATVSFIATIKNNNTGSCGNTTFELSAYGDYGWTADAPTGLVTLAPQASQTALLNLTIPAGAALGSYPGSLDVRNLTERLWTNAGVTVVVGTCTRAPPSLTMNPATASGGPSILKQYVGTVTNNDSAACAKRNFVFSTNGPSGWLVTTSPTVATNIEAGRSTTTTVTLRPPAAATGGTYTATLNASTSGQAGASSTFDYVVECIHAAPTVTVTPAVQSALPGAALTYAVSVKNNDNSVCSAGTFDISAVSPGAGWSVVPSVSTVTVSPQQTQALTVTVTSPVLAAAGTANFSVSTSNVASGSATTAAAYFVNNCRRAAPTVTVTPLSSSGGAGSTATFTATVTNNDAPECDPATFTMAGTMPSGWSASFSPATVVLAPGGSTTSSMTVGVAGSAVAGAFSFAATASNVASGTGTSSAVAFTVLACTRAVPTVTLSPATQSGSSGVTRVYTASIRNNDTAGCSSRSFSFGSTTPNSPAGWTRVFSATPISIAPQATGSSLLSVTPPSGITVGNSYSVNAIGAATGTVSSFGTAAYLATASTCTRAAPTVTLTTSAQSGGPGVATAYTVTVRNNDDAGCSPSIFSLRSFGLPSGWAETFAPASLSVSPQGSVSTTYTLTPPTSAAVATSSVTLIAEGPSSGAGLATVTHSVTCVRSPPQVSLAPLTVTADAGTSSTYVATVYNADSLNCGSSNVSLAGTAPGGWSAVPAASTVTLAAQRSTSVNVQVSAASTAAPGSYTVQLGATGAGATGSGSATWVVPCGRAAPTVVLSPSSRTVAAGVATTYDVTVTNNDGAACGSGVFNLTASVPSGWQASFAASSMTLAPEREGTTVLTVTSSASATPGSTTPLTVGASNSSSGTGSAVASHSIAPCVRNAPSVRTNTGSQNAIAGQPRTWLLTVTNEDTGCPASTVTLSTSVPSSWSSSFVPASLNLASGASATTVVTLASGLTEASGFFDNVVQATSTGGIGAVTLRYVVMQCTHAMPSIVVSPSSQTGTAGASHAFSVLVTNHDDNCPSSILALSATRPTGRAASFAPATLTLASGASASATLTVQTPPAAPAGGNTCVARATAQGGVASAEVSITVTAADAGTGGGVGGGSSGGAAGGTAGGAAGGAAGGTAGGTTTPDGCGCRGMSSQLGLMGLLAVLRRRGSRASSRLLRQ